MTRRLHRCLTCEPQQPSPSSPFTQLRGFTRHADGVCSYCRRRGVTTRREGGARVLLLLLELRTPEAPLRADLEQGVDLSAYVTDVRLWHGTDCPCTACVADRIPGRYA